MKTIFLFLMLCAPTFGQNRIEVSFNITAPATIQKDAESFIARELRSLGDVDIVKAGFQELNIVIAETKVEGGQKIGFTLMMATTWRSTCSIGKELMPCYVFEGLSYVGGPTLRELCEKAVTNFDRNALQPRRSK